MAKLKVASEMPLLIIILNECFNRTCPCSFDLGQLSLILHNGHRTRWPVTLLKKHFTEFFLSCLWTSTEEELKCSFAFGNLPLPLTTAWIPPFLSCLDPRGPHYQLCSGPNDSTARAECGRSAVQKNKCKACDSTPITKIKHLQSEHRIETAGF